MQSDLLHNQISDYVRQHRDDIIRDIKRLVDIESVSTAEEGNYPFGRGFAMALDAAKEIGAELGFSVQDFEGTCASLRTGPADQEIGFFTHLDVVPALGEWTRPPFNASEEGGYLFGRGTLDDKGPTVIVMYTMKCLQELGLLNHYGLRLVMGCNEGCGADGLRKYKECVEKLPNYSIVADALFPVCYAEKGCVNFTITHPLHSGRFSYLSSGSISNVVPALAVAKLSDISVQEASSLLKNYPVSVEEEGNQTVVKAHGVSRHAAKPEGSVNAIGVLFKALHESGIAKDDTAVFRSAVQYIQDYYGCGLGIQAEDETTGRLTHVACMTWITQDNQLALNFNIRYPVCVTYNKILDSVTSLLLHDGFNVCDITAIDPVYTPPASEVVSELTKIYNDIAGDNAAPFFEGNMSYTHSIPNAVAYGPIFPNAPTPTFFSDQRGKEHMPDECIYIEHIEKAIEIYVRAVCKLEQVLTTPHVIAQRPLLPQLTVADIVGKDGLTDAVVVAGSSHLGNVISSISVLEVAEASVGKWVLPNQIYITAFYAIRDNIPMQKVVIKTLMACGCSGLIICHLGHWIQSPSREIIDLCDELGLPLIIANPDTSYASIMEPILQKVIWPSVNNEIASQSVKIRNDILEIAALEEHPTVMLQKISGLIDLKCTYLDIYYKCIYTDKPWSAVENEISYIRCNTQEINLNSIGGMYYIWNESSCTKLIAPIRTTNNFFGYIVLDVNVESKNLDNKYVVELISSLTVVCTMAFSRRGRLDEMQDKYANEYITDLLTGNFQSEELAIIRGMQAGINIQNKHVIMAVSAAIKPGSDLNTSNVFRAHVQKTYLPFLKELVHYHDPNSNFVYRSDVIAILWEDPDHSLNLKQIGNTIIQLFDDDPNISAYVGISRYYTKLKEFSLAYTEAVTTASLCRSLQCENKVASWPEMCLFSSIQQSIVSQNMKDIFEQMLLPLKEYDAQHDACLIKTLSTLIKCNLDIVAASSKLYIHRNTLLYRKNKIVELLDYSPFEMPYYFNYYVAFQLLYKELE